MDMAIVLRGIERLIVASCSPLLLILGYNLFLNGATGNIKLSIKVDTWSGKAINVTPGAFCFLLGAILGGYVLYSNVNYTSSQSETHTRPGSTNFENANKSTISPAAATLSHLSTSVFGSNKNRKYNKTSLHVPTPPHQLPADSFTKTVTWSGAGGKGTNTNTPLSNHLRLILSEIYFCDQVSTDLKGEMVLSRSQKCVDSLTEKFGLIKIPTLDEIESIQQLEHKIAKYPSDKKFKQNLSDVRLFYFRSSISK